MLTFDQIHAAHESLTLNDSTGIWHMKCPDEATARNVAAKLNLSCESRENYAGLYLREFGKNALVGSYDKHEKHLWIYATAWEH